MSLLDVQGSSPLEDLPVPGKNDPRNTSLLDQESFQNRESELNGEPADTAAALEQIAGQISTLAMESISGSIDPEVRRLALRREKARIRESQASPQPKKKIRGGNQDRMRRRVEETAPKGSVITKMSFGGRAPKDSTFPLAIVRLIAPASTTDAQLYDWSQDLSEEFGICVHVNRLLEPKAPMKHLSRYADKDGLLMPGKELPSIPYLMHGREEPKLRPEDEHTPPPCPFRDLRDLPFYSIDAAGCEDPEDALYAERLPNGNIGIYHAVSDVARIVRGDKEREDYLLRAGLTYYGRNQVVHNIGELYKATSLLEGKDRWAFITYGELTEGGDLIKSDFFSAQIRNHNQLSFEEAEQYLQSGSDERMNLTRDAVFRLRGSRLATKTVLDYGRGGRVDKLNEEMALFAYNQSGVAFQSSDTSVFYRIHASPSKLRLKALCSKAREVGVPAKYTDFQDNPFRGRAVLQKLQEGRHFPLLHEYVDTLHVRGRTQLTNWGHQALGMDPYIQTKARKLQGYINQVQAHELLGGPAGFSIEELRRLQARANRKERGVGGQVYRLICYDEVKQALQNPPEDIVVEVGEPNEEGLFSLNDDSSLSDLRLIGSTKHLVPGDLIQVRFVAVDTNRGAMLFEQAA